MELAIKNMVCPRCIAAVDATLRNMGIHAEQVNLGQVIIKEELESNQLAELKRLLQQQGFELLEADKDRIIDRIKSIIIEHIHHMNGKPVVFSELLSKELNKDYSGLSKLFSAEEGITIEQFIILQKIEKVKELLLYKELNLTEIADLLGYSSSAHLSSQFRKITGLTPTAFRSSGTNNRHSIDSLTKKL